MYIHLLISIHSPIPVHIYVQSSIYIYTYTYVSVYLFIYTYIPVTSSRHARPLYIYIQGGYDEYRLLRIMVSFAKEPYKRDYILQKNARPLYIHTHMRRHIQPISIEVTLFKTLSNTGSKSSNISAATFQ